METTVENTVLYNWHLLREYNMFSQEFYIFKMDMLTGWEAYFYNIYVYEITTMHILNILQFYFLIMSQ